MAVQGERFLDEVLSELDAAERTENGRLLKLLEVSRQCGYSPDLSLGRVDRGFAKRKAEELATALRSTGRSQTPALTVGALFDNYEAHVTRSKGTSTAKHDRRALEQLRRYLGAHRPVESPTRRRRSSR